MTSLGDALAYPTEHQEWVKTILIGGALSIFAFLLIPIVLVYGYIVRVLRRRLDGDPQPPTFGQWEELLVDGIKAVGIGFVYLLIPGLVGFVTVGDSIAAVATGTQSGPGAGDGILFGALLSLLVSLLFGYVAVAAIVNFVYEGEFAAAFDFTTLRGIVLDGDYAVAWGLSVVVFAGVRVLVGVLGVIPLLGTVIGAFVFFYAQIVAAHLWADGYGTSRGLGRQGGQPGVGGPAL